MLKFGNWQVRCLSLVHSSKGDRVSEIRGEQCGIHKKSAVKARPFAKNSRSRRNEPIPTPVIIGFMASLLGISGLVKRVQGIIGKIRGKIEGAVDKVLMKIKKMAGKFLRKVKGKGGDKESEVNSDPEHDRKVDKGLKDIHAEEKKYLKNNEIAKDDAETVASIIKRRHPIFKRIVVIDREGRWDYHYFASEGTAKGPDQAEVEIRLEKKLFGSSKHGLTWKEAKARANKDRKPQGKFNSEGDLEYLLKKAKEVGIGNEGTFTDLPAGHTMEIYLPDKEDPIPAKKVWLKVRKSGVVHGFPQY